MHRELVYQEETNFRTFSAKLYIVDEKDEDRTIEINPEQEVTPVGVPLLPTTPFSPAHSKIELRFYFTRANF